MGLPELWIFFFTLQSPNLALGLTLEWRSSSTLSADIVVSFSTTNTPLLSKECTVDVHHSDTFGLYRSRRCLLLLLAVFYRSTTVSVKMVGTLRGVLVPSMLVYTIWWPNRDKQLWEGRGEQEKGKTAFGQSVPTIFVWDCSNLMNMELLGELKRHQPKLSSFTQLFA